MRRSTAAAIGTLTGAALIVGVRLSVAPAAPVTAPAAVDLNLDEPSEAATTEPPAKEDEEAADGDDNAAQGNDAEEGGNDEGDDAQATGLKNGVHQGEAVKNPYGTIQVSIKVSGGKITAADATYPTTGESATINPPAIQKLNQETVQAQSADVDAVSGATFTSESYAKSLQAALDKAGA